MADNTSSQENYIEPNLAYGLRIWWAYYWPTFLISSFLIGILMFLLRRAWEHVLVSTQVVLWANRILPYAVTFVVSILGIYRVLGKNFRSFHIALLPRNATFGVEPPLSRTLKRTLHVWWAFIWRTIVYSAIFRVAGSLALGLSIGILAAIGGTMVATIVSTVLIDGAVGSFIIYSALLDEELGDFRVTLVPRMAVLSATPAVEPAAPNPIP